jgi:hypothetical protein
MYYSMFEHQVVDWIDTKLPIEISLDRFLPAYTYPGSLVVTIRSTIPKVWE